MPFSAVSYGDVAQLLTHYLTLRDLAAWARAHRDGRTAVAHKLAHFGSLSLSHYPLMSLDSFARMAQRIRGLEVVLLPYTHPCLLLRIYDEMSGRLEWRGKPGVSTLLRLLDANAAWLQVVAFDSDSPRPSASECDEELELLCCTLGERAHRWPRARLVEAPMLSSMDSSAFVVRRRMQEARALALEEPPPLIEDYRQLDEAKENLDMGLAATANGNVALSNASSAAEQDTSGSGAAAAASSSASTPAVSDQRLLFVQLALCDVKHIRESFPKLEMLGLLLRHDDGGADISQRFDALSPPADVQGEPSQQAGAAAMPSVPLLRRLEDTVHSFSHLLSLSIFLDDCDSRTFPRYSKLNLRFPLLLSLLIEGCDPASGLSDVEFDCPQLISLNIQAQFVSPPPAGAGGGGDGMDDEEDESLWCLPPSLILSLARSPHLRAIVAVSLEPFAPVPDVTPFLTAQQRKHMDATAAALGKPSVFDEGTSVTRRLYFALGTLACAATLQSLEDCTEDLSLEEYCFLFPAMRIIAAFPLYSFLATPPWLRPPPLNNPIHDRHVMLHRLERMKHSPDRLYSQQQESARAFAQRILSEAPSVPATLALAHAPSSLHYAECARLLQTSSLFQQLEVLYLSAPSRVEPAAVQLLVVECAQLRCLSLIQLAGIGDGLFLELPADLVRPRLETLRLKGVCEPFESILRPSAPKSDCFSSAVVPTLTRLFPELRHFEMLFPVDLRQLDVSLYTVLSQMCVRNATTLFDPRKQGSASAAASPPEPLQWPSLRTIVLNALTRSDGNAIDVLSSAMSAYLRTLDQIAGGRGTPRHCSITRVFVDMKRPRFDVMSDWMEPRFQLDEQPMQRFGAHTLQTELCHEACCHASMCELHAQVEDEEEIPTEQELIAELEGTDAGGDHDMAAEQNAASSAAAAAPTQ